MNKEDMLLNARINVNSQIERIKSGEKIIEDTDNDNNRVVVTKNTVKDIEGNDVTIYGYIVSRNILDEYIPFCYFESTVLFTEFKKNTSYEGIPTIYTDAKGIIERNLTGRFTEYVKQGSNWDMYNVFYKNPDQNGVRITSSVHGFQDATDPVQLAYIDFINEEIYIAAGAYAKGDKTISIDHGGIKKDGTVDYEQMYGWLLDEILVENAFSDKFKNLTIEEKKELAHTTIQQRQSFLSQIRDGIGATPTPFGIGHNPDIGNHEQEVDNSGRNIND